jgi:hypothetical protein
MRMYSSWGQPKDKTVKCIYCGKEFDNPYYKGLTNKETGKKIVYVCSPLRGNIEANIEKAKKYCRFVQKAGHIPIAPHLYFTTFMDDNIPEDRKDGMEMGMRLLETVCHELWVFGDTISEGMKDEIKRATEIGIKVCYIKEGIER